MEKYFKKEYLPGYTGHVPKKMDIFGLTAGEINRTLITPGGYDNFYSSGAD
jgi:hypothetical protein